MLKSLKNKSKKGIVVATLIASIPTQLMAQTETLLVSPQEDTKQKDTSICVGLSNYGVQAALELDYSKQSGNPTTSDESFDLMLYALSESDNFISMRGDERIIFSESIKDVYDFVFENNISPNDAQEKVLSYCNEMINIATNNYKSMVSACLAYSSLIESTLYEMQKGTRISSMTSDARDIANAIKTVDGWKTMDTELQGEISYKRCLSQI